MPDMENVRLSVPGGAKGASLVYTQPIDTAGRTRRPSVLMVHGWMSTFGSTYTELRDSCLELGCNVFMLTLQGHDDAASDIDKVTRDDHWLDIELALGYMMRHGDVDANKIIGVGSSYGAYLLAVFARQKPPFVGLLLRAPALYPNDGWSEPTANLMDHTKLLQWRSKQHTPDDCVALAGINVFAGKLLVVSGGQDEDMPPMVAESYADFAAPAATVHRIILSRAGHVFAGEHRDSYLRYSRSWLEGILVAPSL